MNLNQIHEGEDYAWFEYRGRGENYRRNSRRLKIIRTYSERAYGNTKDTGFVEAFLLDNETGEFKLNHEEQPRIVRARARDIATLWEEYEDEHERREIERKRREAERLEREAKWKREREEREERERLERAERERQAREILEREERYKREREERILAALKDKYGLARTDGFISIAINSGMITVYFDRSKFERELEGGEQIAG